MKTTVVSAFFLLISFASYSQTLFTYGSKPVSKTEFVNAFDKNPSADTMSRAAALKSYLDLYINYKLKVQAAHDEKLDITDEYRSDRDKFKMDMAETAINNEANISSLIHEAFIRSRKDIQLAQVFIPVKGNDTATAFKQINEAYTQLKSGKTFADVVAQYTQDSVAKKSGGNIGFITVFVLPYEAENLVYNLHPGEFAKPYHSVIGYHIFKDVSERPASGNRKVQSILFATSPSASEDEKATVKKLADSVCNLIRGGASFADMQALYNPKKAGSRSITEVSVGEYTPAFENEVYALQKEGDVSPPFYTSYGWNVLKLTEKQSANVDTSDLTVKASMQEKISADDRLTVARQNLQNKWVTTTGYKSGIYNQSELWTFTDSALENGNMPQHFKTINSNTVLFSFTKKKITADDWIRYAETKMQQSGKKPDFEALMPQFISYSTTSYYKEHIEDFHPELKPQLDEFNDANLLFAAMDKHVWSKASTDTTGLLQYYKAHQQKYIWQPGADAIVVTANNKPVADELAQKIKDNPANWRDLVNSYGSLAQGDSSRFESGQLPVQNTSDIKAGYLSQPQSVNDGGGFTFIYVTSVHTKPEPRSFDDARGMVINDYQQVVEDKWLADVKKKYPVKVNEAVFKSIR